MVSITIWRLRSFWHKALDTSRFGSLLALTMLTNLSLAGLSVVSGVLAARLLGPAGRGELAAIQTWPTLLATLAMHGIAEALAYFSAREPGRAGRWLATALVLAVATCLPAALIGYQLMPWLLQAQRGVIIETARVYLWILPVYALIYMTYHPLRGRNDLTAWNLLRLLPTLAWVGVLLMGAAAWTSVSAIPLSRAYLVALALLLPLTAYVVIRRVPGPFRPSLSLVPPMWRYGWPSTLSAAPITLNLRLDQMLMASFLPPEILGLYAVGVAWSSAPAPILNALPATVLPRVAGERSATHQAQLLAQSTRMGSLLSALLAIATASVAPIALPLLFGREYLPAVPATIILSIAAGVSAFNQLMGANAMSLGQPRLILIAESVGLVVTAILLLLLLRPFQLIGAAVASLASYLTVTVVFMWLLERRTGLTSKDLLMPVRADLDLLLSKARLLGFERH